MQRKGSRLNAIFSRDESKLGGSEKYQNYRLDARSRNTTSLARLPIAPALPGERGNKGMVNAAWQKRTEVKLGLQSASRPRGRPWLKPPKLETPGQNRQNKDSRPPGNLDPLTFG